MFANRTNWNLKQNEIADRLQALKALGTPVFDLSESNPTECRFEYLNETILDPLNMVANLKYAPDPKGMLGTRKIVEDYYRQNGIFVDSSQIFLTSSSSEAYSFLFRLLANPGDNILVPRPSYPLFHFLADLNDVELKTYPLIYDHDWHIGTEHLISSCNEKTKAIILVNPNNPTGSFLKAKELEKIVEFAESSLIALISDEVFFDYPFNANCERVSLAKIKTTPTFTLNGISKAFGLPQMKLGWIVANGPRSFLNMASERLEMILDTYLPVSTPVQNCMKTWVAQREIIQKEILARTNKNRLFLHSLLSKPHPASLLNSEGGWYAILKVPKIKTENEWVLTFLEEDHVYVHPGFFFDFEAEAYIVVSLLPIPEVFEEGMKRILKRISETAKH